METREFTGKTRLDALQQASSELKVPVENVYVADEKETKGLFGKTKEVTIYCYSDAMVIDYAVNYLTKVISLMGIEVTCRPSLLEGLIKIKLTTNHNSIIIGKDGETLQAFNEIVRSATSIAFKRRVRILLDVNDYKKDRYSKLISIAKREAVKVAKTKITAILDPMTSDERRAIHNALMTFRNVKTVSEGEGKGRHITIVYTGKTNQEVQPEQE